MSPHPNRYTRRVVQTIALACKEAERLDHRCVGPEHLLLALLHDESGAATHVLRGLHVNSAPLYRMICATFPGVAAEPTNKRQLTTQARRAIELAEDEARRLGHPYIGTEHVLLGLLHEGQGAATWALARVGVTLEAARAQVQQLPTSGRQFDNSLPDRETTRSFRAQVAPRSGFPYQPREVTLTEPNTFSTAARAVLVAAHTIARRAHQGAIGPEHVLLALLERRDAVPARVLTSLGGDLARLRAAVAALSGHRAQLMPATLDFTPHAQALMERTVDEARRLSHKQVDPAHFLLGLTRERDGVAIAVLRRAGLEPQHVYAATLATLEQMRHANLAR